MKIKCRALSALLLSLMLSGCVAYGEAYIPAPPPPQDEVVGIAPFTGAIWVPGFWDWHRRHRGYRWHEGYWRRP